MDPMSNRDATNRKLTYEDYCRIPEDGLRHEILDGEHFVSPSPLKVHQRVGKNLMYLLETFLRADPIGTLWIAPFDVLLGKHTVAQPDLMVVLNANAERVQRNGCHGAPDLVVEILSESSRSRDFVMKKRIYEKAGVAEYWIVDTDVERIEVFRREGARLVKAAEVWAHERHNLETLLLPGLRMPVAEVFV